MITKIRKRNGEIVDFYQEKITRAIFKAAHACGGEDYSKAEELSDEVMLEIVNKFIETTYKIFDISNDEIEKIKEFINQFNFKIFAEGVLNSLFEYLESNT